ncbi:hypothetical protein [Paenibacillus campi]|uniref:hypothetical protein n=1 Tax=Paenibacillus campi TaxID=3106031 RepID=UPI002AFFAE16|nr:hypothetical protein [Paenibacillus sp. SGZ-1014]
MKMEIKDIVFDKSLELQTMLRQISYLLYVPTDNSPRVISDIMDIDESGVRRDLFVNYYDMEHSFLASAILRITTSDTTFVVNGELATLHDLDILIP